MKKNLSDYIVAISVIACSVVLLGALTFALSGFRLRKATRTLQIRYEDVTGSSLRGRAGRARHRHATSNRGRAGKIDKQKGRGRNHGGAQRRRSASANRCDRDAERGQFARAKIRGPFRWNAWRQNPRE